MTDSPLVTVSKLTRREQATENRRNAARNARMIRARKLAEGLLQGKNAKQALLDAGYSKNTARQSTGALQTIKGLDTAMAEMPLQLKTVDQLVGGVIVNPTEPTDTKLRAGDMAYKRLGAYVTVNVNASLPDGLDSVRQLVVERLADVLAARMGTVTHNDTCITATPSHSETETIHVSPCDTQDETVTQNENGGGAPKPMADEGDKAP